MRIGRDREIEREQMGEKMRKRIEELRRGKQRDWERARERDRKKGNRERDKHSKIDGDRGTYKEIKDIKNTMDDKLCESIDDNMCYADTIREVSCLQDVALTKIDSLLSSISNIEPLDCLRYGNE